MINKVLLMEFFKDDDIKVVDKDFYIKSQMKSDVIKYITILEEENEKLLKKSYSDDVKITKAIEYMNNYIELEDAPINERIKIEFKEVIKLLNGGNE